MTPRRNPLDRLPVLPANIRTRTNEVYPACQGEGPFAGVPSVFVRLHGCPVHCAWCDTPYTWDGSETGAAEMSEPLCDRIIEMAAQNHAGHVVITGGEPLIHKALPDMLLRLTNAGLSTEVETAAIFGPVAAFDGLPTHWNLSPKLSSARAKIRPDLTILDAWLERLETSKLKLVVASEDDYEEALFIFENLNHAARDRVWLMPCGTTRDECGDRLAWLLDRSARTGFRVTGRNQVFAYNERRGV